MSASKKDQDIEDWLLMDVPDDPESEDEYDVNDGDTDEQAQQEVIEFSNFFLQSECETGKNDKEPFIVDNSDDIIFDFPEFDLLFWYLLVHSQCYLPTELVR